ncbi:MAG: TspO protein [Algoriphagus sp.]|nr:TspO protein [Algoriphagus sp.]
MPNWLKLIISIILPQAAGLTGAYFTISSVDSWYGTLEKPFFNPPPWLFGPVWTTLYLMMGWVCYLIWKSNHPQKRFLLSLYFIQLALNAIWSPAFFGAESPALGLLVIIPLGVLVFICILQFKKISHWASRLMIPYFLRVCFATLLNISIWYLN